MDAQLKTKWVEALRSGKYEQGRRQLRRDNEFCCLGVLCDLIDPAKWISSGGAGFRYRGIDHNAMSFPPNEVTRNVGLPRDLENQVAGMNDDGNSFAEIADYIEANIPDDVSGVVTTERNDG